MRWWSKTPISPGSSANRLTKVSSFTLESIPGFSSTEGMRPLGRDLYGYFLEADIPDGQSKLVQRADSSGEAKSLSLSTLGATVQSIVAKGLASDDSRQAIASFAEFTNDPGTVVGDPRIFQVWARRT